MTGQSASRSRSSFPVGISWLYPVTVVWDAAPPLQGGQQYECSEVRTRGDRKRR
jgi:hypothetical protein